MTTTTPARINPLLITVALSSWAFSAWAEGGLNIDLGYATAYVFRGLNIFQEDSQTDQNMLLAPGITWSVFDTGLEIGYWGAFQISGNNISENIDEGVGAEQNLFIEYDYRFGNNLGVAAGLTFYFYPFADEDAAGTAFPSFFEPHFGFGYVGVVDFWFDVSYFASMPEALKNLNYFYLNPNISKTFELDEFVGLDFFFSFGLKVFDDDDVENNTCDILFTVGVPIQATDIFYIKPSFNVAWTNLAREDLGVGSDPSVLPANRLYEDMRGEEPDEALIWVGLNIGVNL